MTNGNGSLHSSKPADIIRQKRRELGQLLKQKREDLDLSQEGAGKLVDLTRQQWIRLENGQSGTKEETLLRIAQNLKFTPEETEKALKLRAGLDVDDDEDELVKDGFFSGYYDLNEEQKKIARRQIAAIIRSFKDEDFEE